MSLDRSKLDALLCDPSAPRMARIFAICDTLDSWAGKLTGMDFADERGWLSEAEQVEKAQMDRELPVLEAEAERLWRELPGADPAAVQRYDARVQLAVDRLQRAGGSLEGFYLADLRERGVPTSSPARRFDFWAIWAVHQLTSD
ncbi:MAG: hypothetical protein HYV09_07195 [Deltaproteobacteria bacterium]|nr:hypothetical protein [Deltaproteobacteria bacterium]